MLFTLKCGVRLNNRLHGDLLSVPGPEITAKEVKWISLIGESFIHKRCSYIPNGIYRKAVPVSTHHLAKNGPAWSRISLVNFNYVENMCGWRFNAVCQQVTEVAEPWWAGRSSITREHHKSLFGTTLPVCAKATLWFCFLLIKWKVVSVFAMAWQTWIAISRPIADQNWAVIGPMQTVSVSRVYQWVHWPVKINILPLTRWTWYKITMTSHESHVVSTHRLSDCLFNSSSRPTSKKHQSTHYWPFVIGICRWPVNSPHKGPVTRIRIRIRKLYLESAHIKQNNISTKMVASLRH